MTEEKEETHLKIVCSKGSWNILKYIVQEGSAQHKDLQPFVSTYTLNKRLKDFRDYDLIRHCFVKDDVRKEWYEPTEKGKEVFQLLKRVVSLMEERNCNPMKKALSEDL